MTEIARKEKRYSELDGVRGIAILLVLFFHYGNNQLLFWEKAPLWVTIISKVGSFMWSGVDLFFVLSGFLIGMVLLKNKGSKNYFSTFYWRRFLRIFPLFYFFLLIYLLLKWVDFPDPGNFLFKNELNIAYYFFFVQNYAMALNGTFAAQALTPTWSLAVEEQFYLLLPTLIFIVRKKYLPYLIILIILIVPIFRYNALNWYAEYATFHNRMDTLLFGVLIAYLVFEKNMLPWLKGKGVYLFLVFFITLIAGGFLSYKNQIGVFNYSFFMIIYGILLVAALNYPQTKLAAFLRMKWLRLIGFLSYGIYIFHQLISGALHALIANQRPMIQSFSDFLITLLALVITILLAYLLNQVIEKPLIALGHKRKY